MAVLYAVLLVGGCRAMLYSICTKCPHILDGTCRHVLPGSVALVLLKPRKATPYTFWEYFILAAVIAFVVVFPQYWLWKQKVFLIVFWVLAAISAIQILTRVCRTCNNELCPFNRGFIK